MKYLLFFLFFLKVSIFADLQWFQKGLYADFSKANFKNLSLRIEAIESIHPDIADYSGLAMVVVKSGVPKFFWPHDIEHDFVVKKVMEKYIRKAISQERLNNFTFFFCLHDQYQPKNDFGKFEIPVLVFTKHKNATDEIAIPDWTALMVIKMFVKIKIAMNTSIHWLKSIRFLKEFLKLYGEVSTQVTMAPQNNGLKVIGVLWSTTQTIL